MLSVVRELLENGYLAQIILIVLIWLPIAILAVTGKPIPDALLDAGFVIVGFYFRSMTSSPGNSKKSASGT